MINTASNWYDTFAGTADCVAVAEYDLMTDFIQNSAVETWTVWDDVIKTNEVIQISLGGGEAILAAVNDHLRLSSAAAHAIYLYEGGTKIGKLSDSGGDSVWEGGDSGALIIQGTDDQTYPRITLEDTTTITLNAATDILFKEQNTQMFKFKLSVDDSYIEGGADANDDLIFKANTSDAYPQIEMAGAGDITLYSHADILFYEQGTQMFKFWYSGGNSYICGADPTGADLYVYANDTDTRAGLFLFGAGHAQLACEAGSYVQLLDNTTQMFKFNWDDGLGRAYMYGGADAGDQLHIAPVASSDTYLYLVDNGGAQIVAEGNITLNSTSGTGGYVALNSESDIFLKEQGTGFGILYRENAGGILALDETTEKPAVVPNYGCIWTEDDNLLHFMDGAGTEYTVDITPV